MCGIIGAVSRHPAEAALLAGLRLLEYRGYDSAGAATLSDNTLHCHKHAGRVAELERACAADPLPGTIGIAHTRWATHGPPNDANAHPHCVGSDLALVHNGIVENHAELRAELAAEGCHFSSATDSELIAHLVKAELSRGVPTLWQAVQAATESLEGSYAIAVLSAAHPETIVAARAGSPLVIGCGEAGHFLSSDPLAISGQVQRGLFLEDGDIAELRVDGYTLRTADGSEVERVEQPLAGPLEAVGEYGEYSCYMEKEIFEQPAALRQLLEGRLADGRIDMEAVLGAGAEFWLPQARAVHIVACGTSYHAACIASYWFEQLLGRACRVFIASEYRYHLPAVEPGTVLVVVSQSGETADILAAVRAATARDYLCRLAICNVSHSSLVRDSESVLLLRAGVEVGVASTKAFTAQLAAFFLLMTLLGRHSEAASFPGEAACVEALRTLPEAMERTLALNDEVRDLAALFRDSEQALFIGRGVNYPLAMEGALKLKEISYIHAEAFAAGELKHGPLALVDTDMPVVASLSDDALFGKTMSNLEEVRARGGRLVLFADPGLRLPDYMSDVLHLPVAAAHLGPLLHAVPHQLLAYHVATMRGLDVDKPRNLAKSVTVE